MNTVSTLQRLSVLLALFLFSGQLFAQTPTPNPPVNVEAGQVPNTMTAKVVWSRGDGGVTPTGFRIYKSTDSGMTYSYIGTREYNANTQRFNYITDNLSVGTYAFKVKAYVMDGGIMYESAAGNTVWVTIHALQNYELHFTTTPTGGAVVGTLYTYNANAVANGNPGISYAKVSGPDALTVNTSTGTVSWTPTAKGTFTYTVKAYITTNSSINVIQQVSVQVSGCANPAFIKGTIKDNNGNNIAAGYVQLFNAATNNGAVLATLQFQNGAYHFGNLDSGTYAVRVAEVNGFDAVWYINAKERAQATLITVACGDTANANFVLTRSTYSVSGRVTAYNGGAAVYPAQVFFYGVKTDSATGDNNIVRSVWVTQNGTYTIQLPKNYIYTARAIPNGENQSDQSRYLEQYYNNKTTPAEANTFILNSERSDINFALADRPTYTNAMSGTLRDSTNSVVTGYVVASLVATINGKSYLWSARSTATDAQGAFSFVNLIPGEYVLFGVPAQSDTTHSAGYYKVSTFAVFSWQESTRITVGNADTSANKTIKLRYNDRNRGAARFQGRCGNGGITIEKKDQGMSSEAVGGVAVFAINSNGKVSGYTLSDADGQFSVNGLAKGKYTVIVDKVGFAPYQTTIDILDANGVVSANPELKPLSVTGVSEENSASSSALIFPNPAAERFTLQFAGTANSVRISVVNTLGTEVFSTETMGVDGVNTLSFDAARFTNGMYMVRIQNAGTVVNVPLTIIR